MAPVSEVTADPWLSPESVVRSRFQLNAARQSPATVAQFQLSEPTAVLPMAQRYFLFW